jgi:hypothetical protein
LTKFVHAALTPHASQQRIAGNFHDEYLVPAALRRFVLEAVFSASNDNFLSNALVVVIWRQLADADAPALATLAGAAFCWELASEAKPAP